MCVPLTFTVKSVKNRFQSKQLNFTESSRIFCVFVIHLCQVRSERGFITKSTYDLVLYDPQKSKTQ